MGCLDTQGNYGKKKIPRLRARFQKVKEEERKKISNGNKG
jgi:hypothetical protein